MRIWHKILVAPAVAIAFLLTLGAMSWYILDRQGSALEDLASHRMDAATRALDASRDLSRAHSDIYRLFTWVGTLKQEEVRKTDAALAARIAGVTKTLAALQATGVTDVERKHIEALLPPIASYAKVVHDAVDIATVDVTTAAMAMQAADKEYERVLAELDALVQIEQGMVRESYQSAAAQEKTAHFVLLALVAVAVAASVLIAASMSSAIVRPLETAIGIAARIARGDLSVEVEARGADETADLLRTLSDMVGNLRELVGEVAGAAHRVADTSAQIAQGNQDLSQRTEHQAGTLEETSSSMQELTSTVALNAQNARQANELAVDASETARKGGEVVGAVVSTMDGISEASRRISEIIGVIDGIAFQTNILALNAAVEAARAGEQGRGFAVVASEVRSLARRSADAAREVKALIEDSVQKVDAGARLVDAAGRTMGEIVASARKVSDLIGEIAHASQEQNSGIQQVNAAVAQMDHVVQQNATLVEEASAATESMKAQAGSLLLLVARFQLNDAQRAGREAEVPQVVGSQQALAQWQLPALAAQASPA